MILVSIDIETTGLDANVCQIIEVAAVIEDTTNPKPIDELPVFRAFVKHGDLKWENEAYNLHLNSGLLAEYEAAKLKHHPEDVSLFLKRFLMENGFEMNKQSGKVKVLAAGANFGFDKKRLELLPRFTDRIDFGGRFLDPSHYYTDLLNDKRMPSLATAKARAGFTDATVKHKAEFDAKDVIRLLRLNYGKYSMSEPVEMKSYDSK